MLLYFHKNFMMKLEEEEFSEILIIRRKNLEDAQ